MPVFFYPKSQIQTIVPVGFELGFLYSQIKSDVYITTINEDIYI